MALTNYIKHCFYIMCLIGLAALAVVCWLLHILVCFITGSTAFLLVGAIIFPVGMINGFGILVGFW